MLALGAGVSYGCALPSWPALLVRIGARVLPARGGPLVQELIDSGMTLPAIAGILESAHSKGATAFVSLVRDELYRDFPFHDAIDTRPEHARLVRHVREKNSTMRAVAALCVRTAGANPGDKTGNKTAAAFSANDRVHAILNFNFDSVLRSYTRSRYGAYLFRTIESATKARRRDRIPMYHIHGFLKFYQSARRDDDRDVPCVFTEGEYFDFFNRPHGIFNYTFLYLLREFSCLFIGLSMNDENIRRLLHYSTAEFRQAGRGGGAVGERTGLRHFAVLKRSGSDMRDDLTDLSLRRLGTRVLWLEDHQELPERLAHVYGEQAWAKVA